MHSSLQNRIGVMVDSFQVGVVPGLALAKEVGAGGVQMYVGNRGALAEVWTPAYRREVRDRARDLGLAFSAVCVDMGGVGFESAAENAWRVPETKARIDFAREMGASVVTTHIGVVPSDPHHPRFAVMREALDTLGLHAKQQGVTMAIETGPETPETLKVFIEQLHGGVGVNFDPANLVMVLGVDIVKGVHTLAEHIVHTHAKDGRMIEFVGGETLYHYFAQGDITDERLNKCIEETPLGKGSVDLPGWIQALRQVGYQGYFTIERECGQTPKDDIQEAVRTLRALGV